MSQAVYDELAPGGYGYGASEIKEREQHGENAPHRVRQPAPGACHRVSVHIDAPLEKVFDFFKDPANWQQLQSRVVFKDVKVTNEDVGTSYRWTTRVLGLRVEGCGVFTEFVSHTRITDESSRSFDGTFTYSFEPDDGGMRLTIESRPRSFWRLPPLETLVA